MKWAVEVFAIRVPPALVDAWWAKQTPPPGQDWARALPREIRTTAPDGVVWSHAPVMHFPAVDFDTVEEALAWRPDLDWSEYTVVAVYANLIVRKQR